MSTEFHARMLRLALHVSSWSKDPTTKVGAVVCAPSDPACLVVGVNGFAPGADDSPELFADRTYKRERVLHAEGNALWNARGRWEFRSIPTTLYVTGHPCLSCAVKIHRAKVQEVIYLEKQFDPFWAESFRNAGEYLKKHGIPVTEVPFDWIAGVK